MHLKSWKADLSLLYNYFNDNVVYYVLQFVVLLKRRVC